MSAIFLDIAYAAALLLISPYLLWRSWRTGRYRQGWSMKLWGAVPRVTPTRSALQPDRPETVIWLHAVSVGEVNLLATLITRLESLVPDCRCVISTTTDTGYALAVEKYAPRQVFFCPLDFSWAVRRALRRVQPDLLVLAELELWPNLIQAAIAHGAKVAVVNARLSESSAKGYARVGWLIRRVLQNLDWIAAQTDEYADRFRRLGARADRVTVTGSVKFDGACGDRGNAKTQTLNRWAGYHSTDVVFLAGSTQSPEEALALETYLRLRDRHPALRLILAPRHPERRAEVVALLQAADVPFTTRSEPDPDGVGERVLLVDVVGELGAWWGRADIAFVGGSMGTRGGQNMIEPAAYGCPVSFGPKTRNFRDVVLLMKSHQAAVVVEDQESLTQFVASCLDDPAGAEALGQRGARLVCDQQGAADRTVQHLASLVDGEVKRFALSALLPPSGRVGA